MRKDNKEKRGTKPVVIFFAVILAVAIVGYLVGFLIAGVDVGSIEEAINKMLPVMVYAVPALGVIVNLVFFTLSFKALHKSKQLEKEGVNDEEKYIEACGALNLPMVYSNIIIVFNIFLVAVFIAFMDNEISYKYINTLYTALYIGVYLIFFIIGLTVQRKVVGAIKRMNPEKKGNYFDLGFQKQWISSMDEGEKLIQYKAAFKAYRVMTKVIMIMFVVALPLQMLFNTGIIPSLLLFVIYIVMFLTYSRECIMLENNGK